MFVGVILFGIVLLLIIHFVFNQKITAFPCLLVIIAAISAAGSSNPIWDIRITETGIAGPVRRKKKLIISEIKFEEIIRIKYGIPILTNYYLKSKDGSKIILHFPYLSLSQINKIFESIKSNSKTSL